ncbi:hypothetical protein JW756_05945 [Candidatus Woesearchaeota archaeon]|nr:hypothetical protein [Candidatus Woesearchaeota archaeon]
MWMIITLIAAIATSTIYFLFKDYRRKLKLGLLALMMLGTFLMVLVDHVIALIEGEPLIELTTDGLISNGALLGISMVLPIFLIWAIAVLIYCRKEKSHIQKISNTS